jgi:hypothetical protein
MIRILVKPEAAMVILAGAPVGMPSHQLQTSRDDQ